MNISFTKCVAVLSLFTAPLVHADTYEFNGTFGAGVGSVSLQFSTGSPNGSFGGYDITGIAGNLGSFGAIDALIDANFVPTDSNVSVVPNADDGYSVVIGPTSGITLNGDNRYYSGPSPNFDSNGLLFHLVDGDYALIRGDATRYELIISDPSQVSGAHPSVVDTAAAATVVPLPAAALLLLSGLGGLGFGARRRSEALVA